jgi:hypothetical protein
LPKIGVRIVDFDAIGPVLGDTPHNGPKNMPLESMITPSIDSTSDPWGRRRQTPPDGLGIDPDPE